MYISIRKQFQIIGLTLALALGLFVIRSLIFGEWFFPSILWNIFLAFIPWAISTTISGSGYRIIRWIKGALWLLFLPNAFYIATDLIHLRESTPQTYWIDLILLLSFTSSAFLMGFYSFNNIERMFTRRAHTSVKSLVRVVLFLACSYGLYLGRVLRWNSWDLILHPRAVIESIFQNLISMQASSLSFTISLSFFLFLFLIYHLIFIANRNTDVAHEEMD
jgi:uncharacterized membrane protein